jgi:hypothetical protein
VVTHVDLERASRVTTPTAQTSVLSLREAIARASAMRSGRMADAIVRPMAAGQTLRQSAPETPAARNKQPAAPALAEVPTE